MSVRLGPRSGLCVLLCCILVVQGAPVQIFGQAPAGPAQAPRAADDWPQFHHDPARTGETPAADPSANTTIWSLQTGGPANASPAILGEVFYGGSADGWLYAVNYSSGDLLWKAKTGGPVGSPAVSGTLVFAGSWDGSLHAFSVSNGTEAFSYQSGAPVRGPVLATGGTVVFGNDAGNITALDTAGNFLWANTTGAAVRTAPALGGNLVFVCSGDGLAAYSILTGERSWNLTAGSGNLSHPCYAQGRVYVGSGDGVLRAFNAGSGAPAWSTQLSGAISACPAASGGSLYVGTAGQRLHIVNATTGAETNVSAGGAVESSAAVSAGAVVFGTPAGITALARNGTELWSRPVAGGVSSSPALSHGRVFAGTIWGAFLALGPRHTARISSSGPSGAPQGTRSYFNGTSPDCVPVAYQWRSSLDGLLSNSSAFNISTLTLGLHQISLRVQDGEWVWSDWDTVAVEVTPPDDWPFFRKDTSHRGCSAGEAPQTSTVVWNTYIGGQVYASPVVYQGMVFAASRLVDDVVKGGLYALDVETGALRWSWRDNYGVMDSTPACADGMVFVGDDDGNLYAFDADPSDGIDEGMPDYGGTERDLIWTFENTSVQGSPVVAAGKVIVPFKGSASINPSVCAFDEFTGKRLWSFPLPDPNNSTIWSSPAVDSGLVLFGSNNKRLYALDLQTGREVWNFTTKGTVQSSPSVSNDLVYFGSSDAKLYALNLKNGTKKWDFVTADEISGSPAVADGKVFFGSMDKSFRALDADTGQPIWSYPAGGNIHSSPAVGGGLVIFGAYDGRVYALNETTGRLAWPAPYDAGDQLLRSSPALAGGRIYIGTETGSIIAFGKAPDLYVPAGEINLSLSRPLVGQEVRVTARVYNIGTLNASAFARISDGLPGVEIASEPITVPVGQSVEISGNWTVPPGIHTIVVNVTNTTPYEAYTLNNQAGKKYEPPAQAGWTMFKYDPERTSAHPDLSTPNSNSLAWSFETGSSSTSSPVAAGTRLYQAAGDSLFALDARDGSLLWRTSAGSAITSTPAVANLVVFGTAGGQVMALNEWDGSLVWSRQTGGEVASSPLIVGGTVYVGSSDGYLYAFSLDEVGQELWKRALGGPVLASVAYDPQSDILVAGSLSAGGTGRAYGLYSNNGTEVWSLALPGPAASTPAVRAGTAYIGCDDGQVHAIEILPDGIDEGAPDGENATADTLWTANLSSLLPGDKRIRSSPAVDAGRLYVGAGFNSLFALNLTTGAVDWRRELGSQVAERYMMSSPAVAENRLFAGADGLYALNPRNGSTVWSYQPGGWFWSSPALLPESPASSRGVVYATTEGGRVCAFSKTVPIQPVAIIGFPAEGQAFRVGEAIRFNGSASYDMDGDIVNQSWDFGDGNSSANLTQVHVYDEPGGYLVSLSVWDDRGLEGSASVNITVRNNSAPSLGQPFVDPGEGDVSTLFMLRVTYFDEDNDTARTIFANAGGVPVPLEPAEPEDQDTADGKEYYCETTLPSGIYGIYFEASDGVLVARTPVAANLTVTNRSVFVFQNTIFVELFYAGRGGVDYTSSLVRDPEAPLVTVLSGRSFLLSEHGLDRWMWANISVNYSSLPVTGINLSTLRIYWWNTSGQWVQAENAFVDNSRNLTFANVTVLGNFTVAGLHPPNRPPVAKLSRQKLTITEGETAQFDGSASSDPDGDEMKYFWDFGDGQNRTPVPGGKKAEHKYTRAGRYTVILVAKDNLTSGTPAVLELTVKQKGGEQYALVLVVVFVVVVGILFLLPRGEKKSEDRWKEEDERFRKGMDERKPPAKTPRRRRPGAEDE